MLIGRIKTYCKEHKTELLVVGGVSVVLTGTYLALRHHNNMVVEQAMNEVVKHSVNRDYSNTLPFEVRSHIRKLPTGMHASPTKALTAYEHGYILNQGETWVETYVKMSKAA